MPIWPIGNRESSARPRSEGVGRREAGLWALVVMVATALGMGRIYVAVGQSARLDYWDMAKYAVSGLRLRAAALDLNPWQVVLELHSMSVWPPFWPSGLALAFSVGGLEPWVPRLLMIVCWGAVAGLGLWAAKPLRNGTLVGLLVTAWWLSGPFFQGFAALNMLEIPGLALQVLALGAYLRAVPEHADGKGAGTRGSADSRRRAWKLLSLASLALIFCKYNYGLLWLVPLGLAELRRRSGTWGQATNSVRLLIASIPWRHPLTLLIAAVSWILVWVRLTGGVDTELLGTRLRMTSIGNPAYGLYLLCWGIWLWRRRVDPGTWRALWRRLCPEHRIFVRWCLLPTALWMLLPPHMKELFGFLENRDSGLDLASALGFYPGVLLHQYALTPVLGAAVMGAALLGLRHLGSPDARRRMVALGCWVAVAALMAHPYKLDRFAFQAAWWLGLCAAITLAEGVIAVLGGRARGLARYSAAALVLWAASTVNADRVLDFHRHWTVDSHLRTLLNEVARPDYRQRGVLVLGTWNGLSPALVEWISRAEDEAREDSPSRVALPATDFELARRRPGRLSRALEGGAYDYLAVIEMAPGRPDFAVYQRETAWLAPIRDGLEDRGYLPLASAAELEAAGYTLTWWRRAGL